MASHPQSRLLVSRHRQFIGRAEELALFQSALSASKLPFRVLYLFGPGGVGKTTLLYEFEHVCRRSSIPVIHLHGGDIQPVPESFQAALRAGMEPGSSEAPLLILGHTQSRLVVLIDGYEALIPLESWLVKVFLPQLSPNTLVVFAGRPLPSLVWRTEVPQQTSLRSVSLRNFAPSESRTFLTKRRIPMEQHETVLQFTHGHPLALSLVADLFVQRPGMRFQPGEAPGVLKLLLEQFVQAVPGPSHRVALEACAIVRSTTEGLLGAVLAISDAHELFEWLRGLSFIESGPFGLYPHEVAREVLVADLRWRNPDWYAELHRRIRSFYRGWLERGSSEEQERVLADYIFLHRDNPVIRPFFDSLADQGPSRAVTEIARKADWPELMAMVQQHEGEESARLATLWFTRQPQGVIVFRDEQHHPAGFLVIGALHQLAPEEVQSDPAAQAAWRYLHNRAPLRPGESATLFRFWMARDAYQGLSPIQSLIFIHMVRHYLTTPRLAFTFLPCADPDYWALLFAYAELARLPEADFEVGGHRYGVYGHDWRVVSPTAWLDLLADKETGASAQPVLSSGAMEAQVVLSYPDFEKAIREALRNFARPNELGTNPLLRSRLVMDRGGIKAKERERIHTLRKLLEEAVASLQSSPREAKLYRAVDSTYLHPAPTQEQAAELLNVPFSTYRRHLKTGIVRIARMLWDKEIGAAED